jgi:membrane-associated HD superfamily phosphohydrolase
MAFYLFTLIVIYFRAEIGYSRESRNRIVDTENERKLHPLEYLIVQIPFSLILGWITAATLANFVIAGLRDPINVSEQVFSSMLITLTSLPALLLLHLKNDFVYSSVIVWAVVAIGSRQANNVMISTTANVNSFIVLFFTIFTILKVFFEIVVDLIYFIKSKIKGSSQDSDKNLNYIEPEQIFEE